jgi:urease accessory protein
MTATRADLGELLLSRPVSGSHLAPPPGSTLGPVLVPPSAAEVTPALSIMHLLRLFQLASPALPVGGYSYSQGLEAAVNAGQVKNAGDARLWLEHLLVRFIARSEAPLILIAAAAFADQDKATLERCCEIYRCSRETAAARDETRQMAWSLRRLAIEMNWLVGERRDLLEGILEPVFPVVFAIAAGALGIEPELTVSAYLFSWLENQTIALQKLAPVGQSLGQQLLFELGSLIPAVVASASARAELGLEQIETMAPHLGLLMARHASQYSRLFRT